MQNEYVYDFNVSNILYVLEKKPNQNWRIENLVYHDYHALRFCMQGNSVFRFKDNIFEIKQGDLLFSPKGSAQTAFSDMANPWGFFVVVFDIDFYGEKPAGNIFNSPNLTHIPNSHKISSLFSELNRAWISKEQNYVIKARSIIMEILSNMIMSNRMMLDAYHHGVEKALDAIHQEYTKSYSVAELAQLAGISESHFRFVFKKTTGMTSVRYQNQIKINKAKDFLLTGNYNITETADHVGINNVYYFSELFKRVTGMSPSEYIKKI